MNDASRTSLVTTLRELMTPLPARGERCELCDAGIASEHSHLVDTHTRRLLCACRVCSTVGGRYRSVPSRYVQQPSMRIASAQWEALGIPVGLVFFFFNSHLGRVVACYPGPAGATESLLPLDAWPDLARAHPWVADLAPDVEALLVQKAGDEYPCFIVPIDACYELAGRIRQAWSGFGGGDAVDRAIGQFFATVQRRSTTAAHASCAGAHHIGDRA